VHSVGWKDKNNFEFDMKNNSCYTSDKINVNNFVTKCIQQHGSKK
jgi:hypothetical protein